MNEKTEKDGTGKLQNSAGIAKTESSTAATCAQTSADADRASRTIPAAASRRLGTRSAYIGIHRGSPILFSLQEPCTILTIVPQSAGFHPTETVCKRSLSGRFRMGRQNFCSVSPCF